MVLAPSNRRITKNIIEDVTGLIWYYPPMTLNEIWRNISVNLKVVSITGSLGQAWDVHVCYSR